MTKKAQKNTRDTSTDLKKQVSDLQDQVELITEQLKRSQADFVNFKRRMESEREDFTKYAYSSVLEAILPTVHQLEKSLEHIPAELKKDKWVEGIKQIYQLFESSLRELGVSKIKTVGEQYHPEMHEAVMVDKGKNKDEVLEEFEAGYMYKDKVLRPAKVKVCNEEI